MNDVKFSTDLSINVQIITCIIGLRGIFLHLTDKHKILREVLILEIVVQLVELMFYIYFLRHMAVTALNDMAAIRYFDWVITTPIMLLTTIIFYKYEEHLEKGIDTRLEFWDFIKDNKDNIITIFVCNFLMLIFGYLGEIGTIDMVSSLSFGFLFFGLTFYTIYKNYAIHSKASLKLFYFVFVIWGMYGIAALMSSYTKNNMFNVLDIFAKNFFGLYLYYRIKNVSRENIS
jgi:bacteriorhodopsin